MDASTSPLGLMIDTTDLAQLDAFIKACAAPLEDKPTVNVVVSSPMPESFLPASSLFVLDEQETFVPEPPPPQNHMHKRKSNIAHIIRATAIFGVTLALLFVSFTGLIYGTQETNALGERGYYVLENRGALADADEREEAVALHHAEDPPGEAPAEDTNTEPTTPLYTEPNIQDTSVFSPEMEAFLRAQQSEHTEYMSTQDVDNPLEAGEESRTTLAILPTRGMASSSYYSTTLPLFVSTGIAYRPEPSREYKISSALGSVTTLPPPATATTSSRLPPTTVKPTTKVTTQKATIGIAKTAFVFRTYGFGHGVGMSQVGAIAMASAGNSYAQILAHYYPGTKLEMDANPPANVRFGDDTYGLVDYLARTAEAEIGRGTNEQAFKAQVVAAYTFAKQRAFTNLSTQVQAMSSKVPSATSLRHVREVLGMQTDSSPARPKILTIDGKPAFAPYFASSAGKTTSLTSVWGGTGVQYRHLTGGVVSSGTVSIVNKTITFADFKKYVAAWNKAYPTRKITLNDNPASWLTIQGHDKAVSDSLGYISKITVGGVSMTGYEFRYKLLDLAIRSHCFSFELI
ncbi:MAG: hypothetical protein LBN05_02940 [Oscillospiraceae bacterium]|jgi:peptidoglycan hydrolase-like amidase|nr:hypothetical protein [Oscillospiraceae bacterium]